MHLLPCAIAMLLTVPDVMQRKWPAGLFVMGFVAFPMPEIFPKHYWLFHSLWHVLLAAGYYELYVLIEFDSNTVYKKAQRHKHLRSKQQNGPSLGQGMTVSEADEFGPSQVSSGHALMLHQLAELACHQRHGSLEAMLLSSFLPYLHHIVGDRVCYAE